MNVILLLFFGGCLLTIGDICQKIWITKNNNLYFVIGIFLYMVGSIFLVMTYKTKNMALATMIFMIFNILTLTFVEWYWYNSKLNITSVIGILFGAISIYLLENCDKGEL